MNCISGITICLSVSCGVGVSVETAILAPEMLLHLYKEPRPFDINYVSHLTFMKFAFIVVFIFNIVEFILYVIIFWDMNNHHRRHAKLCLSNKPKLANRKKRQNTITAVGNFTSWVAEALINGIIQYVVLVNSDKMPLFCYFFLREMLPSIYFVIFPIILSLTSPDLRHSVFSPQSCKESCLSVLVNCNCKCTNCKNDVEGEPEEIELQVMPNGNVPNHM